tara:strand:- start:3842 stop:4225 length:384 start_codon:yes stop_codon:yes gene_type:complete
MSSSQSIYDRIGGDATINLIVEKLYREVMADPELSPFFIHSSQDKLKNMQRQFIAAALGGPNPYSGRSLAETHKGRGISRHHIQLFINHLISALRGVNLDDDDVHSIQARINLYADEVTGDSQWENP